MKIWNSQMNHKIDLIKETIPVTICEMVKWWWWSGVWLCCVHLEPSGQYLNSNQTANLNNN